MKRKFFFNKEREKMLKSEERIMEEQKVQENKRKKRKSV